MKNLKHIKIALLFLTLTLVSCNDNLDLKPEDTLLTDVVIKDPANVQKLLVGTYGLARSSSSYGGSVALASELLASDGELGWKGTFVAPGEFYDKAILADNSYVENIWLNGYKISNQSNIVLANLKIVADANERTRIEGEAKFLRGLVYFDLARLFSKPYIAGTVNSQLGVPIVLEPVLDPLKITFPRRNTVEEVYKQVISDLTDAYNLLPKTNGFYATKYATAALLARVYLQQGDFEKARDMADFVIKESGNSLYPKFEKVFNNPENSTEDVFAWQVTSQDKSANYFNTFWAGKEFGGRSGNPDVYVKDEHLEIYDDTLNDQRMMFFYTAKRRCTTKWKKQFANIPFIRLAEMYLIRAEANQRKGTSIGNTPLEDINVLRARSGASLFSSVDLDAILMERKRELSFEGFTLFDAKRLGKDIGSLSFDANELVMPIPLREMDANPNLVQNEGYN